MMSIKYKRIEDNTLRDDTSDVEISLPNGTRYEKIIKHLESGSGFGGFTPKFFGYAMNTRQKANS